MPHIRNSNPVRVSGIGCCLVDILYTGLDFSHASIRPYLSVTPGDGGLSPGHLVFLEDLEHFAGKDFRELLPLLTENRPPDKINIGGPAIVPLIHLSQMTSSHTCEVTFRGRGGQDDNGRYLAGYLQTCRIAQEDYRLDEGYTPSTFVFSDPAYNQGHGERMFVNTIGAANLYQPGMIGEEFFKSGIVVFGGTALVPVLHDNLESLLEKSRETGAITVVNTVFDFRNEKKNPGKRWPLGSGDQCYPLVDLLIADHVEALRLSGTSVIADACRFFMSTGLPAFIITNGPDDLMAWSDGSVFEKMDLGSFPVSADLKAEIRQNNSGDTTGCGDNFVGGILYSLVNQLNEGVSCPDLAEAIAWGVVSGGFAGLYVGGTYQENYPGEKLERIKPFYEKYRHQIGN